MVKKVTTGDGFTVMLKVWGMPEHPLGVTFIVAIIGLELVFVGVNEGFMLFRELLNQLQDGSSTRNKLF
jgi:hypothetical protein